MAAFISKPNLFRHQDTRYVYACHNRFRIWKGKHTKDLFLKMILLPNMNSSIIKLEIYVNKRKCEKTADAGKIHKSAV